MKKIVNIKRLRLVAIGLLLACAASGASLGVPPANTSPWEQVQAVPAPADDEVVAEVRDGHLYVWLLRPAKVQLFTILGQPVADASLPAGAFRLKLASRGIYILKAGSTTKRIIS